MVRIQFNNLTITILVLFSILFSRDSTITISGMIHNLNDTPFTCENSDENFEVVFLSEEGILFIGELSFGHGGINYYEVEIDNDLSTDPSSTIPNCISVSQNYPNPFNPETRISAYVPNKSRFEIFDILGREINSAVLNKRGNYALTWGGADKGGKATSAGIYLYRLSDGKTIQTGKMTLLDGGSTSGLTYAYKGEIQNHSRRKTIKRNHTINGTLQVSAPCITDVALPVTVCQDTIIDIQCNQAPHGFDRIFTPYIDDTLIVDLNTVIYNDSPTIFEISENELITLLNEVTLLYIPTEVETLNVEVTGFDSLDVNLTETVNITTYSRIDDTSHPLDVSWEIDTLGIYFSNLRDVAIVNENDIWAVGEIRTNVENPSLDMKNLVHWNGVEWEMTNVLLGGLAYAIEYFQDNDIWIILEGFPTHWDGNEWTLFHLQNMGLDVHILKALWSSSSENIYFVGDQGSLVHYNGIEFTQIESGTEIDLRGVSGSEDGEHVFAVGFSNTTGHSIVLEIENNQCNTLYYCEDVMPSDGNMGSLYRGTDVSGDTAYFATTQGLWKYNYITGDSLVVLGENVQYVHTRGAQRIIAQSSDDISILTWSSGFIHYNGIDWQLDNTLTSHLPSIHCMGGDYKGNTIVAVGEVCQGLHAYIARGYRESNARAKRNDPAKMLRKMNK
ncbi:MAG: T9SS type A sorting domain-containing protein [Candidatus Marinimicrobia bacterium]|nr:T9SS type A sorting domain-containing protein [Candidatus Neomarinimicrobiota bacterium]